MNCELCSALQEEFRIIHRNEHIFIIVNIEPVKEGHVMILPVRHAEDLRDLAPEEAQAFLKAINDCMDAVTELYDDTPICHINGWKHRTQNHLHAHVIPSREGLRRHYALAEAIEHERKRADQETMRMVAEKFRGIFEK